MKKTSFLLIAIIFCIIQVSKAQTPSIPSLSPGWVRIYIKNVGSFDLPTTMEIQKGKYKEFVDEIKKIKGFDGNELTAQQKGLNEFGKKGFQKYARVMIGTTLGKPGEFEKLNFNISKFAKTDISELNTIYKQQIQQSFIGTGLKLISYYPLRIEKINGMSCIHISYTRQLQDNPIVLVNIYYFHNNDRMHSLTLSYRLSELDYWKSDYAAVLKSFRITDLR